MLVQGSDEHGQMCHQDMPGPALEGDGRVQFEVHERQNAFRQGIRSRNARGECDWGISGGYGFGNSAIIISKHLNSI